LFSWAHRPASPDLLMIEVKEITVRYGGITALDRISLAIPDGKMISIVGANGAGKSTTINAISGMVPLTGGEILFEGRKVVLAPHLIARQGVVQVPEGRKIFSSITVKENLLLGAYRIRDRRRIEENLKKVYKTFPILEKLLDEPSLGLAPLMVLGIFKMIQTLHQGGFTVLLVEQNAQKALTISDYAYVLETGRMVAEGEGKKIAEDPVVKKAYLGIEE
jgi:branched-chain amino acid transport system ATP-binding protein